jgi:hypothetical protein
LNEATALDRRKIFRDISYRTNDDVQASAAEQSRQNRRHSLLLKIIFGIWVCVIPAGLVIFELLGPEWVGLLAATYALSQIWRSWLKISGRHKPTGREKEEEDRKQKMERYYYHCERNLDGFSRLKVENLSKAIRDKNSKEFEAIKPKTTTPTDFQKALVEEATYLRGKILTGYAQVEFLLADLSVRLDLKFPYRVRDRIKAAKRLHERARFEKYQDDVSKVCDDLLRYEELRHFMAHGFLSLHTDPLDNHQFEMHLYQREDKDNFVLATATTTLPQLKSGADDISEYVTRAVGVFQRIYLEQKLEE